MPTVIEDFSSLGKTIYLKVDFETLLERLKAEEFDKRPLFADVEFARKIFEIREPIYTQKSELIVDANMKFDEVLKEVSSKA
jgi:shikimate kinase